MECFETPDDAFATFSRPRKTDPVCPQSSSCQPQDIIDLSNLTFGNDEEWLMECPHISETDLNKWLYEDGCDLQPQKNFDSRTFTRPKKRFTRPSIEKYNEELYGSDLKESTDSGIQINGEVPTQPLDFDLGQNASSVYFEKILANTPMLDSFQNMSPPSLVNSMCSSTFANLMENSFIKNDPELREIRDTDFTGTILQQEDEPTFHSISESCSSVNSDVPESFLKKVSLTEKSTESINTTLVLNATFAQDKTLIDLEDDFQDAKTIHESLNCTYPCTNFNSTFQRNKSNNLNTTIIKENKKVQKDKSLENVKRLLNRRASPSLDLNRLSYIADKNGETNSTFTKDKRNSFGSTDSGDNQDYMSLSSSSSKSSRVRSIDGINHLDELQDKKLSLLNKQFDQIQSTPRAQNRDIFWANADFSPISGRNSDPELSSNETCIIQKPIIKQKSVGNINQKSPTLKIVKEEEKIRGSQPNLKLMEPRTLRRSNLNSMGHTLKGSYTSLRPTNTNLPVAPPPLDATVVKSRNSIAQVPSLKTEAKNQDAQFVKPQPRSGLPRPVTGIPRPVSRIPGPKTMRPATKSAGYQGRH